MEQKNKPTTAAELETLAEHWRAERKHAAEYLAHLEQTAFSAIVQGKQTEHYRLTVEARGTIATADSVLAEISRQLPYARALAQKENAGKKRTEAQKLVKEAEELEAKIAPLLAQIEAIEGCLFVPPARQAPGSPPTARSQQLRLQAGRLLDSADHFELNANETLRELEEAAAKSAGRIRADREQVTAWA